MRPVTVDHKYLVSLCLDTLYIMAGTYSLGYLCTLILKIDSEEHQYLNITILWYFLRLYEFMVAASKQTGIKLMQYFVDMRF